MMHRAAGNTGIIGKRFKQACCSASETLTRCSFFSSPFYIRLSNFNITNMSEDDYGDLRKKNIAERKSFFSEFFKELKTETRDAKEAKGRDTDPENSENEPPRKKRRTVSSIAEKRRRSRHVTFEFRKKYNTRSSLSNRENSDLNYCEYDEDSMESSRRGKPKLQVLFSWAKPFQRSIDLMKMGVCDVDQEKEEYDDDSYDLIEKRVSRPTKSAYDPSSVPSVDEITEEMLANIAEKSTVKTYDKIQGTCCHQCRQKTLDTKTVCRSGECIGIRGQFCGPCLKGRYGESALEALKDPNWACPPCRDLCNCSICRTRSGLRPTGILAPLVQEEGYTSVMDYLRSTEFEDT